MVPMFQNLKKDWNDLVEDLRKLMKNRRTTTDSTQKTSERLVEGTSSGFIDKVSPDDLEDANPDEHNDDPDTDHRRLIDRERDK